MTYSICRNSAARYSTLENDTVGVIAGASKTLSTIVMDF